MWVKFVKFMTGPFAGMSAFWNVVEQRMHETSNEASLRSLIEELITNHPMATDRIKQFSGAKIKKTGNEVRCHAMPIGMDLWVGGSIGVSGDHQKIYICEDQNADIDDATLVFFDRVKIPGEWQNVVQELLVKAVAEANELKAMVDATKRERDHARANSSNYSV